MSRFSVNPPLLTIDKPLLHIEKGTERKVATKLVMMVDNTNVDEEAESQGKAAEEVQGREEEEEDACRAAIWQIISLPRRLTALKFC